MILLSAILFLFLCLINLRLSFLIILALLPSYLIRFDIFSIPVTFLEMMIIILFVVWLFKKNFFLLSFRRKPESSDINKFSGSRIKFGMTEKWHGMTEKWHGMTEKWHGMTEKWHGARLFFILILLFILSATISIFIAPDLYKALGIWKAYFIEPIILLLIGLNLFKPARTTAAAKGGGTESALNLFKPARTTAAVFGGGTEIVLNSKNIIFALSISALLVSLFAVYQKFTGFMVPYTFWGKGEVFRVTSFYGFPNAIGLFLAPLVPLFFYTVISNLPKAGEKSLRWGKSTYKGFLAALGMTGLIILSLLSICFAHSTGAVVALFSGLIITGLFFKKTRIFSIIFILLILLLLVLSLWNGFIFNFIPEKIIQELTLQDWSGFVRKVGWQESLEMLKNNFIFGAGLSGYPEVFAEYHKIDFIEIFQYPHNIILNFWSEIGLGGLIIFILLIIYYFYKIYKTYVKGAFRPKAGSICYFSFFLFWSMMVILIHGLVDVPYFKNDLAILFWVLFLLVLLNHETSKNTT